AGKSYCSRRFGGATCDDKSAQIYARFDKNDWRIQPAEFYRFHDAEVNTFGDRKSGSAGMPRPISYAVFCLKKKKNPEGGGLEICLRTRRGMECRGNRSQLDDMLAHLHPTYQPI